MIYFSVVGGYATVLYFFGGGTGCAKKLSDCLLSFWGSRSGASRESVTHATKHTETGRHDRGNFQY